VSGRREYGGERAEAGTGMNRNKLELNRKSTTLLTWSFTMKRMDHPEFLSF
jgi:hypothetical protein